jgi:hypothetical protein
VAAGRARTWLAAQHAEAYANRYAEHVARARAQDPGGSATAVRNRARSRALGELQRRHYDDYRRRYEAELDRAHGAQDQADQQQAARPAAPRVPYWRQRRDQQQRHALAEQRAHATARLRALLWLADHHPDATARCTRRRPPGCPSTRPIGPRSGAARSPGPPPSTASPACTRPTSRPATAPNSPNFATTGQLWTAIADQPDTQARVRTNVRVLMHWSALMRRLAAPFVVAPPCGGRIRTRLRPSPMDEMVLWTVGRHLGSLAGGDLAARCRLGYGDYQRTERKRALTPASSSRWAGTVTRTSNDQWQRAFKNLLDERTGLRRAIGRIQARLAVPVGQRLGRVRGYASQTERFQKLRRLQHLTSRLAEVEQRIAQGRASVCRGGRRLAKLRHAVGRDGVRLTKAEWRERWEAERLFLTADGEAAMAWGNQTIRVHPNQQWLELRLPTPLAHLSNTSGRVPTYRLSCPVRFSHRAGEWAAQAASGAVRYDISFDPARRRWYLDASWQLPQAAAPSLEELRRQRALGVDLNAGHLDCWVIDPCGNPCGPPRTIPLNLATLPASTRDGHLRAAITANIQQAKAHGCRSIVIENLDFADARQAGRETLGRGRRGRQFRRVVSGIPTRRFRDLLVGMAANAGLWVVAVDPGWTSVWGRRYWQPPLSRSTKSSVTVTGHHAAAVVIGRRGLGLGARRRPGVTGPHQWMGNGELPARLDGQALGRKGPDHREASRQRREPHKTRQAERTEFGDQVVHDRSGPPGQKQHRPAQGTVLRQGSPAAAGWGAGRVAARQARVSRPPAWPAPGRVGVRRGRWGRRGSS